MRPALAMACGAALLAVPVLLAAALVADAPSGRPQGPTAYVPGQGNLTRARQLAADLGYPVAAVVSDLGLLEGQGLVVMAAADGALAPRQEEAIELHLARGGSVWLAGGVGLAPWLAARGVSIGTQPLLQDGALDGEVLLEGGLGPETLTRVSSVLPGTLLLDAEVASWEVWLRAPASAHIDLDRDGTIGQADPPGPFPVGAALRQQAGGLLIVTADTSLLSDAAMAAQGRDNVPLWQGLLGAVRPEHGVVFDESHHGWTAAEAPLAHAVGGTRSLLDLPAAALAGAGAALLAAGAAVIFASRPLRPFTRHQPSDPSPPLAAGSPDDVQDIAWDLLALRTGRPLAELRAAGADAARGLAEDPALRRVLLRQGSAQDRLALLESYSQGESERPT